MVPHIVIGTDLVFVEIAFTSPSIRNSSKIHAVSVYILFQSL